MLDTPISEQAIVGAAIGAALKGLRPVAEVMFADFAGVCFDQIANQLAKYRYMSGGTGAVPVTMRMANGAGVGFAAQHSQSVENWFLNVPGLKIVVPGTPADAYGLLRAAIRDDNPVLVLRAQGAATTSRARRRASRRRAGPGRGRRAGGDVTVVATQLMRQRALEAAGLLAEEGIEVELIDPRTLVPLDLETIGASVEQTNRLVVVQEARRRQLGRDGRGAPTGARPSSRSTRGRARQRRRHADPVRRRARGRVAAGRGRIADAIRRTVAF